MKLQFVTKNLRDLTDDEINVLMSLTNKDGIDLYDDHYRGEEIAGSGFRITLGWLRRGSLDIETWAVMAQDASTGRTIGWCGVGLHPSYATVGFYVHHEFRRNGVANQLMERAEKLALKLKRVKLVGQPWNDKGFRFFLRSGFTQRSHDEYVKVLRKRGIIRIALDAITA